MSESNIPAPGPSLRATDSASRIFQVSANRVSLDSITEKVAEVEYHNPAICPHMTVAFVRMKNGYVSIGESAPADPANFNAETGRQFAFDAAIRRIWRLEGYALRERMHAAESITPLSTI